MGPSRILVCADKDNTGSYMAMVEFSSFEEAMESDCDVPGVEPPRPRHEQFVSGRLNMVGLMSLEWEQIVVDAAQPASLVGGGPSGRAVRFGWVRS